MKTLTHWGRVTHISVSKLATIGSDNGLSPDRRHAIIWTNAGILLIGPLGINFSEILSEIHTFAFKKMRLKMSSGKLRPFCLGLNVLIEMPYSLNYRNVAWQARCFIFWKACFQTPKAVLSGIVASVKPLRTCMLYSKGESRATHCSTYRKISNIRRINSPNLNVSRLVLQLSLPNPLKPGVKSRMTMLLEQRRQAMLQLHLSDRQFYCLLRCALY